MIDAETVQIVYKALHYEAPDYLKELFHRLSDILNRELRNSKTDLHIPLLRASSGHKALPTGEYAFGTTSNVKQKQVDRSPPLKQNRRHEEIILTILTFRSFYHIHSLIYSVFFSFLLYLAFLV